MNRVNHRFKHEIYLFNLSLSETLWSARVDASKAFATNFDSSRDSLMQLAASSRQPAMTVHDANSLVKKLKKTETVLLCVIWKDIFQNTDRVNKAVQGSGIELRTVVRLYDALLTYLRQMRDRFDEYEAKSFLPADCDYSEATSGKRTRKRMVDDGQSEETFLNRRENFIYHIFFVIVESYWLKWKRRAA